MFCDYCYCVDCKYGTEYISHCLTANGTWICDVCYNYDVCTNVYKNKFLGPCEDMNCEHRPKLIGNWIKGEKKGE